MAASQARAQLLGNNLKRIILLDKMVCIEEKIQILVMVFQG